MKRSYDSDCDSSEQLPAKRISHNEIKTKQDTTILDINSSTSEKESSENACHLLNTNAAEVGISEYISNLPGFSAIIKQRYSDFIVNEIEPNGNIVHLTDLDSIPKNEVQSNINSIFHLDPDIIKKIEDLIGDKEATKNVVIEVTNYDKDQRRSIHEAIRYHFPRIESTTETHDGNKVIVIRKQLGNKGRRCQPHPLGNYLHFVLYKENRDTMDAINTISSFLRISSKVFSYAGTKDKRSKSSQLVSAYQLSPEKLLSVNKKFNMIKVGNLMYKQTEINLGDLSGNHFKIILRKLDGPSQIIEKSIASLASNGFINYYGMQRFGTKSISTHSIGRLLLIQDWKNAIDLILKSKLEDDENYGNSYKIWSETGNAEKAYENLKKKTSIEGKLLKGLIIHKNDFCNALNFIPRNTLLMYIHSYQSFIWNQVVSKRIKQFGLKVLVGDLISDSQNDAITNSNIEKQMRYVTESDIQNISIHDIFLPLPGYRIKYPNNEIKHWYEEFLKLDGMDYTNFESKVKKYSLGGDYRKIVVKPTDFKWEIIPYDDATLPLVISDLDVFQGVDLPVSPSGSLNALKLEFSLPTSCYATMALREILKCETSYIYKKN